MTYTSIWPRLGGNEQSTNRTTNEGTDLTTFGIFNVTSFTGFNCTVDSPILVQYDSVLDDEIFYFSVRPASAADTRRVFAVRANGPKSGTLITTDSIVWQYNTGDTGGVLGGFHADMEHHCLALSTDGETIYFNSCNALWDESKIVAIHTDTGSLKWEYQSIAPDPPISPSLKEFSPGTIATDFNGDLILLTWFSEGYASNKNFVVMMEKVRDNGTSASLIDRVEIVDDYDDTRHMFLMPDLCLNDAKNTAYYIYTSFRTGTPGKMRQVNISENSLSLSGSSMVLEKCTLRGMAFVDLGGDDIVYTVEDGQLTTGNSQNGFRKYNWTGGVIQWTNFDTSVSDNNRWTPPAVSSDGTIYAIHGKNDDATVLELVAITDNGSTSSVKWRFDLPDTTNVSFSIIDSGNFAAPIIGKDDLIYFGTPNKDALLANFYVIKDNIDSGLIIRSTKIQFTSTTRYVYGPPTIGNNSIIYVPVLETSGGNQPFIYLLGEVAATTTTTSSTTTPAGVSSSSSSEVNPPFTIEDLEAQALESVSITATIVTDPISIVETELFKNISGVMTKTESSQGSNSSITKNTPIAGSFSFGPLAPGETSETIALAINIPNARAITNIKIGLIDTGDVAFDNTLFGITSSSELRSDITPTSYFGGINSESTGLSSFNLAIENRTDTISDYVYLNVKLPKNNTVGIAGVVRYRFFFDYEGTTTSEKLFVTTITPAAIEEISGGSSTISIGVGSSTITGTQIPDKYIISGGNNPLANGTYIHVLTRGDAIIYAKDGEELIPDDGYTGITSHLNVFRVGVAAVPASLVIADFASTAWCPSCQYGFPSTVYPYYPTSTPTTSINGYYNIDGQEFRAFNYGGNDFGVGGGLPPDPYPGDTIVTNAV